MRDPYVENIMNNLKDKHETETRGIVSPREVRRLCGVIRKALAGKYITDEQRARLLELTQLQRCFTVAEANLISDMSTKRVKIAK